MILSMDQAIAAGLCYGNSNAKPKGFKNIMAHIKQINASVAQAQFVAPVVAQANQDQNICEVSVVSCACT